MSSLKALDKKVAQRRQVYKPILSSPYVNELQNWPHVRDQPFVVELLKTTILNKTKHLAKVDIKEWPWTIECDYNKIVSLLSQDSPEKKEHLLLFVCNKDTNKHVPAILLQQIPTLCYLSKHSVTMVQLPTGSFEMLRDHNVPSVNGLLLIHCDEKLDSKFVSAIKERVDDSRSLPWLDDLLKFKSTNIDLIRTTQPLKR